MGSVIRSLLFTLGFRIDDESLRDVNESVSSLKNSIVKALKGIAEVSALIGFGKLMNDLSDYASEAEDIAFKFNNIYGELAEEQNAWAENFASSNNLVTSDVKDSLSEIQRSLIAFAGGRYTEQLGSLARDMEALSLNLSAKYGSDQTSTVMSAVEGSSGAAASLGVRNLPNERKEAMRQLGIGQENYDLLLDTEKAMVNYQMLLNANTDAMDAYSRSQELLSVKRKMLNSQLTELKQSLGEFFIPAAKTIVDALTDIVSFLNNVLNGIKSVTDALGITEALVKALLISLTVMAALGVARGISAILPLIAKLNGSLVGFMKQNAGLFAILVAVLAIIQDITNFVNGKTSKIGWVFEKLGIDTDKARAALEKMLPVLKAIPALIAAIQFAGMVKGVNLANSVFGKLFSLLSGAGIGVLSKFGSAVVSAGRMIATAASALFPLIISGLKAVGVQLAALLANPVTWIIAAIVAAVTLLIIGIVKLVKNWDTVSAALKKGWDSFINSLKSAWEWIKSNWTVIASFLISPLLGVGAALYKNNSQFREWVDNIIAAIKGLPEKIRQTAQQVIQFLASLPKRAFEWGKDLVQNMIDGILGRKKDVDDASGELAQTIDDTLGFSLPSTGPLSDFDNSMPDMISMMETGIRNGRGRVFSAASELAGGIKSRISSAKDAFKGAIFGNASNALEGIKGAISYVLDFDTFGDLFSVQNSLLEQAVDYLAIISGANSATLATAGGILSSSNRNIVQNVTFNQEFNGEATSQRGISKAAEKSGDDLTGVLSRLFGG